MAIAKPGEVNKGRVPLAAAAWVLLLGAGSVHAADPLPAEARLVAAAGAPSVNPTNPTTITVAGPQDLTLTLTDLQIPAEVSSASVAVTQGGALVGSATLANPATSATLALPAANGTYSIFVVGNPGAGFSVGTYTVCVAPTANTAACIQADSFAGSFTTQGTAADPTTSTLSTQITVASAGSYTFSATDFAFPAPLNSAPSIALFQGATVIQAPIASGSSLTLNAGTYTLLAIAQASQVTKAGIYGITVTGAGGSAPLLDSAIPVGLIPPGAPFSNPSAQSVTMTVTDYGFPTPLQSVQGLLSSGGRVLATVTSAGGTATASAAQGPLELWTYAAAGTSAGSYAVDVAGATDLYTAAQGAQGSDGTSAYAFVVSPALAAGTAYQITATDLQFPSPLAALSLAVAQNGALTKPAGGSATLAYTPGPVGAVVLLAGTTPPAVSANCTPQPSCAAGYGLLDVAVQTAAASPQLVFDRTQAVGAAASLLDTQTLNIGAASANFDVTVTDLKFPAAFANLALVVSQGGTILGKIYGGGTFTFPGTAGSAYQLTFAATPAAAQQFGLYAVSTVFSPPTVTLTSSATSAPAGSLITLSWTSTNATSCTAGGGNFTGSIAAGPGSQAVRLDATTTYTLQCVGPGGSASSQAQVSAVAAPGSSHGGGAMGTAFIAWLALAAAVSRLRPRRVSQARRSGR